MLNCPFCHRPVEAFERDSKDGAAVTLRCPVCRKVVPAEYVADYHTHPPLLFSMIGMTSHGKTTFLNSFKLALDALGRQWPGFSKGARTVGSFRHGRLTDPTRAGVKYEPEFLTLSNVPRVGGCQLLMYDTGGENFNRVENIVQFVNYTLHSRCVVWLIGLVNLVQLDPAVDPVEVLGREAGLDVAIHDPPPSLGLAPITEDGLRRVLYVLGPEKLDEMLQNYRRAMLNQSGDLHNQSLIVVLTKGDYLGQILEGFPKEADDFLLHDDLDPRGDAWERLDALSQCLRDWLARLGYHNFVHNAEQHFGSVHYCVASAYTPNMELRPTPRGVLAPLFWLWRLQRPAVWIEAGGRQHLYFSLREAIDDAPAGATVRLEAGHYTLDEPLVLNQPLHLVGAGEGETTLEVAVDEGDAVVIDSEEAVTFEYLRLEHTGGGELQSLLHVQRGRLSAAGCRFVGSLDGPTPRVKAGVVVRHAGRADFRSCRFHLCQAGLALLGESSGTVADCTFQRNSNVGVMVRDQASCRIEDSRAGGNGLGVFCTSKTETVLLRNDIARNQTGVRAAMNAVVRLEENRCRENTKDGVLVEDSTATLTRNTVTKNLRCGLRILGASGGEVLQNAITDNGGDGVQVAGSSKPSLAENELARNEGHGLHVLGVAAPPCQANRCHHNGGDGIAVREEAQPLLRSNHCSANKGDGLSAQDAARPGLERNECLDNDGFGLSIARSVRPVRVRGNVTRGNRKGDTNDDRTWW